MLYIQSQCPAKKKKAPPSPWKAPPSLWSGVEDDDLVKEPEGPPAQPPPPDGGLRAWLVVFAAFSSTLCTFGYINSFGVYQTYYSSHFLSDYTASQISWIGSIQLFFLYLGGAISGPLADRFGYKTVVAPSCAVMVLSVMATSLCTKYNQFILAQGILGGMAISMIFAPAISIPGQYFSRRRAFASGIASGGAPVGGVLFPIVLNRLLGYPNLGFGWSVRVVGFIMLVLLTGASILLTEFAPRRKGQFFIPSAFKNPAYVMINVASIMAVLGLFTPIFYIGSYSVQHGTSLQFASYQISILNCMSFFGRIILGYVADKIGRYNMMSITMASTGILTFCWTSTSSVVSITVFAALFGFFSGAVTSLYPPCIAQVTQSTSDIGTYVGMGMATVSLSALAGTPINGVLVHTHHNYNQAAAFSGAALMAGACITAAARYTIKRELFAVA